MPRSISQSELDDICRAVGGYRAGASVDEIAARLGRGLPRRTLQRRLAMLLEQGRLVSKGRGRGCRYFSREHVTPERATSRDEVLAVLSRLKPELVAKFSVSRLAVFGSTVRNEAGPDSDVDIVVEFDGPATSTRYFGLQFRLEDELGRPVDLISQKGLRKELRPYIERESVNV